MRILNVDELTVGEFYWCRFKAPLQNGKYSRPAVHQCYETAGKKYISENRWWVDQALHNYDIYGPVEIPLPLTVDIMPLPER